MKTHYPILVVCLFTMLVILYACRPDTANAPLQETESLQVSTMEKPADEAEKEPETPTSPLPTTAVYICESTGAKKYHLDANCHGLKRCKHSVKKVSAGYAEGKGLELCGHED